MTVNFDLNIQANDYLKKYRIMAIWKLSLDEVKDKKGTVEIAYLMGPKRVLEIYEEMKKLDERGYTPDDVESIDFR